MMKRMLLFLIFGFMLFLSGCSSSNLFEIHDIKKPIIKGLDNMKINYNLGDSMPNWLEGITVIDDVDGDLTEKLTVDATNVNMSKLGSYIITYSVSDESGNIRKEEVTVNVKDLTSPTVSGFTSLTIGVNSTMKPDWLKNILVEDNLDGVITNQITVDDSNVNYDVPGDYIVNYNVTDISGNSTNILVKLTIVDEDGTRTKPVQYGSSYIFTGNDNLYGEYKVKVTVNYMKRGEEAESIVLNESSNNLASDENSEYLITNVTIKLLEIDETNDYYQNNGFTNWDNLKIVSKRGKIYNHLSSVEIPKSSFNSTLYKGESCTGNIISLVNNDDYVFLNYDNTWFKITSKSVPVEVGDTISMIENANNFIAKAPILDETWLSSITLYKINTNFSTTSFSSRHDYTFISELYNNPKNADNIFLKDAIDLFNNKIKNIDQYENQLFYVYTYEVENYIIYFPKSIYWSDEYKNNLNKDYLSSLDKLSDNEISYQNFFNTYGTHLIQEGIYGGKEEILSTVLSNENELSIDNVFSEISIGIPANGGTSTSITHSDDINYFSILTQGGIPLTILEGEDYNQKNNEWARSFDDDNSVLISTGDRGLIPLWDILPSEYEHLRDDMEAQFNEYIQQ